MEPIHASLTYYQSMVDLYQNESDRGAAVLAGSYVENYLGLHLTSKMANPSLSKQIFSSGGSLATFSQRIDIAEAFGFLSKLQCADLRLIKKIRNHFAHHPKDASFNERPVSDWVGNLIAAKTRMTMPDRTIGKIKDARLCYLISAGIFVALNMKSK